MLFGSNMTRIVYDGKVSYVSESAMKQIGTTDLFEVIKLFPSGIKIVTTEDRSRKAIKKKILHRSIKILVDIFIDALMAFITFFFINLLTHETHVAIVTGWISFVVYVIYFLVSFQLTSYPNWFI